MSLVYDKIITLFPFVSLMLRVYLFPHYFTIHCFRNYTLKYKLNLH